MNRYFRSAVVVISVLLTFAVHCRADRGYSGHGGHYHGNDWNEWAAAMSVGLLGLGLWSELSRPHYPPPQQYMQPMPEETIQPGYMYYCVYSNGYYPYVKGCPGGWLMVVPLPTPRPE